MLADLADAGDADAPALQLGRAPHVLGGGEHPLVHAERGEHAGVAGAAGGDAAAGHVVALLGDHVHVLDVGADVAGRDVPAAEPLHEPSVRPQQVGRLVASPGRR